MNLIVQKFGFDQFLSNKILEYIDFNNHNAKFKTVLNELTDKLTVKKIMFDEIKFIEEKKHGYYFINIDTVSHENAASIELLLSKNNKPVDIYYNPYYNIKVINTFKKNKYESKIKEIVHCKQICLLNFIYFYKVAWFPYSFLLNKNEYNRCEFCSFFVSETNIKYHCHCDDF